MGNLLPLNISINEGRADAEESGCGFYVNGFFKSLGPLVCERRRTVKSR
jgi:hypothetical protein